MKSVSVCIICKNEADIIHRCLSSVKWANEIIVVDSGSADNTVEIAKQYTDRVIFHEWEGYVKQKNYALSLATCEWVFSLDADEECTDKLRDQILEAVKNDNGAIDGYEMKRHPFYLGKWINHCGWYPDWKMRLARRTKAKWEGMDPHDKLVVDGKVKTLDGDINHYNYRSFVEQLKTIDSFSTIVAKQWREAGKRFNIVSAALHPMFKFIETYFWKLGFLDGIPGLVICGSSAFYVFCKYAKLYELERKNSK